MKKQVPLNIQLEDSLPFPPFSSQGNVAHSMIILYHEMLVGAKLRSGLTTAPPASCLSV